ncbi:hypothetical protein, partial [Flavobacterium poyangense]|uniref:hypothetical protein n=1 Tax=Flavobacterium poyangense TaxID=2204302 RepID=UPI001AB032E6
SVSSLFLFFSLAEHCDSSYTQYRVALDTGISNMAEVRHCQLREYARCHTSHEYNDVIFKEWLAEAETSENGANIT